jgi:hypothetical protein
MSAAEVIELIKKLPPEELAEVENFIRTSPARTAEKKVRYASDAQFEAVTDCVFRENSELLRRLAQ